MFRRGDVFGGVKQEPIPAPPNLTPYAKKTDIPAVPDVSGLATKTDLVPLAKKTDIPVVPPIDTAVPPPEKTGGAAGSGGKIADSRHQHPRMSSATYVTLGANAKAQVDFTRTFPTKPTLTFAEVEAVETSQPVICRALTWIRNPGGDYIGVVIQGFRFRPLPTQNPVSVGSLLTGVITGLNSLISSLTGFSVTGGSAVGAEISVIALQQSTATT